MDKKPRNPYWDQKMGFWKRLGWILNYYNLQILVAVSLLVIAGYILYVNLRPQRDVILNVMMINGNVTAESDLFDEYLADAGFDIVENQATDGIAAFSCRLPGCQSVSDRRAARAL